MNLKGRKVLVTGADGFIGSHLTEHLLEAGADVRAFVYYNSFNSWGWLDEASEHVKHSIEVFAGDIRDPHGVRVAMKGCDVVMHLAALIAIPYSYEAPLSYLQTNAIGTLSAGLFDSLHWGKGGQGGIARPSMKVALNMDGLRTGELSLTFGF